MGRESRRAIISRAFGFATMPWLAAMRVRAQNPRDAVTQIDTLLGQILAWEPPWHLRVHEPLPGYADSIILDAADVRFAFVLHDRESLLPEYQSARRYRDSLIEDPDLWNLDILAVFSDERGEHALAVDQHNDRVYYYCVSVIAPRYLLERGLYAGIDDFTAGWDLARIISLDGRAIYAGFDEARVLTPLAARTNGNDSAAPDDAERTYLIAVWAFYFQMRASTEQLQALRRESSPERLAVAVAPIVELWEERIGAMRATIMPAPAFSDLDAIARSTADAYAVAVEQYDTMTGPPEPSPNWTDFFNNVALAEVLLAQLKRSLDRWEIPAQAA